MSKTCEDAYFFELPDSFGGENLLEARRFLVAEKFPEARALLNALVESDNAAALYLSSSFSEIGEKVDDYEKRHILQLRKSAELDFPPALHKLGVYYDAGEYVERDVESAALFFERAAERGYLHSQWIHGEDLLYGRNGFKKNEALGMSYIQKAADAKFEEALDALAEFYEKGLFGIQQSLKYSNQLRAQLKSNDLVSF